MLVKVIVRQHLERLAVVAADAYAHLATLPVIDVYGGIGRQLPVHFSSPAKREFQCFYVLACAKLRRAEIKTRAIIPLAVCPAVHNFILLFGFGIGHHVLSGLQLVVYGSNKQPLFSGHLPS